MGYRRTDTETAARDFLETVRGIGEEYEWDGREICARFEAVKKECAEKVEAASTEKWHDTRRLNADTRARIDAVAQVYKARAEYPEAIEAARLILDATIGGACRDSIVFEISAAEAALSDAMEARRGRERLDNDGEDIQR